jgi:ABC-2 type transport system ATP-binding protein
VIFLDEPTSALDLHSRLYTWELIEQLKQDVSKTIVLTTHYMEEAERLCDEIMIMNCGRIIAQGNPSELVSSLTAHHAIEFQFARGQFKLEFLKDLVNIADHEWNDRTDRLLIRTSKVTDVLREILAVSEAKRVNVLDCDISRPSLEDVFLSHTGPERRE